MKSEEIIVVGAGIAGLTSAAILSNLGFKVILIESHHQSGGCAGTFKRKKYIFDVGATQVAGLEEGGVHYRIFKYLKVSIPKASILDPACIVDLNDGAPPIHLWYDNEKWLLERKAQFPDSEVFWNICSLVHKANWKFANRNPVIPIRNIWDFTQFTKALNPQNLATGILLKMSIYDLLTACGCNKDKRLINFLNLQLKLYSQENVYNTAALYGCTVLQMPQKPHGLWHLDKSMQQLSKVLEDFLRQSKIDMRFGEKVSLMTFDRKTKYWHITTTKNNLKNKYCANDIIFSPPPQSLKTLLDKGDLNNKGYLNKLNKLPNPTGALVFYSAINKTYVESIQSNHYQFAHEELGSLFISISEDGDGRAPEGQVTLIASLFTDSSEWINLSKEEYQIKKQNFLNKVSSAIEEKFKIGKDNWLHRELATPLGFQRWTNRPNGIVGGLGQNPSSFGLFGLPSRTPLEGLWLCGDSIYPGEGTAGVSQSAIMAVRQLLASRGLPDLDI